MAAEAKPLLRVVWDDGESDLVHAANLIKVDEKHLEPA